MDIQDGAGLFDFDFSLSIVGSDLEILEMGTDLFLVLDIFVVWKFISGVRLFLRLAGVHSESRRFGRSPNFRLLTA